MDHIIVFTEEHLRRILSEHARYYNELRPHLSLGKDAPWTRPIEWFGDIIAQPDYTIECTKSEFLEATGSLTHQNR
jgi:exoribonuclease II